MESLDSERNSTNGSVYWIRPLSSRVESPQGTRECDGSTVDGGAYVAIQKLITSHPLLPDSEIETILEAYVTGKGECLWRRVSVWSGPNSQKRVIHSSFVLPTSSNESSTDSSFFLRYYDNKDGSSSALDNNTNTTPLFERPSLVCWAAFPEKPDHKLLCVLAGPSTISIWDVYPQAESEQICVKGEGHTVPLPFRCNSIHPLGEGQGLLLQRQEDPEDMAAFQHDVGMDKSYTTTNNKEDDTNNNSGFIVNISSTPGGGRPAPTPRTAYTAATTGAEIPSLFTMQHWLEEIVPVALESSPESSIVTDVFEKVVHTTTLRWRDLGNDKDYEQPILVTYNTAKKRHAIWTVKAAPSSSSMEPLLWRRSRDRTTTRKWDNLVGVVEQDLEDMELLGVMDPQGPTSTRDEALADALGLRRTPRMAGEAALGRGRPIEPRPSRNRNETVLATNTSGFLQNTSRSAKESFFENDVSFLDPLRPHSNLRPAVALDCLFEESEEGTPAFNVFLASSLEGGLTCVGFVRSHPSEDAKNKNSLHLYSVLPSLDKSMTHQEEQSRGELPTSSHTFEVKMLPPTPCLDAQPVQTTRKIPSFLPQSTEILVLKRTDNGNCCMDVFRAEHHLMECALLDTAEEMGDQRISFITGISNPVRGSLDFLLPREGQGTKLIRGYISLEMESNALAEKALAAIESSMFNKFLVDSNGLSIHFALKFRSDCCRLEQTFRREQASQEGPKDSWSIVAALLHALFDYEYFGSSSQSIASNNTGTPQKSPWELLLNSPYHAKFAGGDLGSHFPKYLNEATSPSAGPGEAVPDWLPLPASFKLGALECLQKGISVVAHIFDALHFLYEDHKLSSDPRRMDELRSIGGFLVATCFKLGRGDNASLMQAFLAHYRHDLGSPWVEEYGNQCSKKYISAHVVGAPPKTTSLDSPPCILAWLDAKVRKETDTTSVYEKLSLRAINRACIKTRLLLKIFNMMLENDDQKVVSALREEGFLTAEQVRDELPTGAAIPILEVLKRFGDTLGQANISGWGADEYNLIRRNDLGHHHGLTPLEVENKTSTAEIPLIEDTDKDGIIPLQVSSALLFPADNRIKEAGRLLRSSRPCPLSVPRGIEVSDHEYERLKQIQLLLLCRRALALPVGRGMLTFGSFQTAAAEPLPVPELCLAGRVAPTNANLALDVSDCQNGFLNWPEFHNGVAAGLRLPPASETGESGAKITRSWIVYNRPPPNAEAQPQNQTNGQRPPSRSKIHMHGGLLLALGLRGHLSALEMTDIYDYLTQGQVTLTCGVLLGMAANKRGTCDISVSKMLCLHLPSLMPQQFSAIDVASAVQTAAVTGTGLLFQGSSHRLMTEFLLNEIGKRPDSDVMLDREAYTLSCGIALGMINICKGDCIGNSQHVAGEGEGIADLRLGERLCRFLSGGFDENETRRTKETHDRLNFPGALSSEQERCCCIYEGDAINVDVTAAGSTLALGLIYMRTNNRQVSAVIGLPDTHTLLEYVRPDFLTLRVVSKALILWDDVTPSAKWIEDQLPRVVREAYKQMQLKVKNMGNVLEEDDEMNGTGDRSDDAHHANAMEDYDCQVVRQIYVHVVAGACFGLGLRFAGTGDKRAAEAIRERLLELQSLRDLNDSVSQSLRPEPQILETCLGCCAISLAIVNAGTGDLETLRLLKMLRWRCDEQVKFGGHMSLGLAIGLLFLGGGTCTLGREPQDIAALVAAFFPRFPYSSTDNQYHLQAIRHLYALAVKKRNIRFADSSTGEIVQVPIEIYYGDCGTEPLRRTAPCLVPNGEGASVEVRVVSENYYPLKFELNDDAYGRILFVKRRTVCSLPKSEITYQHSLQVYQNIFKGAEKLKEYLQGNPYVLAFVTYLLVFSSTKTTHQGVSMEGFTRGVLKECLSPLSDMTFPIYLRLWASTSLLEANPSASRLIAWDLKLICSYYETFQPSSASPPMLNSERLAYLQEIVQRIMQSQQ